MDKNLKKMIDNVADGDMAAAGDAFNAAADARRSRHMETSQNRLCSEGF